jgi:hypothetical protein
MPGFRDYVTKTTRTIPVVVLERVQASVDLSPAALTLEL